MNEIYEQANLQETPSVPLPLGRFFLGNTKSTFGIPQVCRQSFCN